MKTQLKLAGVAMVVVGLVMNTGAVSLASSGDPYEVAGYPSAQLDRMNSASSGDPYEVAGYPSVQMDRTNSASSISFWIDAGTGSYEIPQTVQQYASAGVSSSGEQVHFDAGQPGEIVMNPPGHSAM